MNTENKLEEDKARVSEIEGEYTLSIKPSGVKALWPAPMSPSDYQDLLRIAKDGLKYKEGIEAVIEYMDEQWSPRRTAVAWRWKDFEYILGRLKEIQQ